MITVGAEAAPLLARIHAEAFPPAEAWGPDAIGLMLGLPGTFGVLADEDGEPAGFALARVAADVAEVLTIATRPAARRRGHGRAMFAALAQEARAHGAAALFLEVSEANAPARALYAALGAREVGRRPRYYADGSDALVLRADLAA